MKNLILFFSLIFSNLYAQKQLIHGTILDSLTKQPIAFASITEVGTKNGTLSNQNGEFNIYVTNAIGEIKFSCIGYKSSIQKVALIQKEAIYLQLDEQLLTEIIVMPDSSLKELLNKAYSKISFNYPQKPTELIGFYRETQKLNDNRFLYFGEANIKIQHSGYQKSKEDAQIEVIKARISNFPNRDSIDNSRYANGIFIANWNDPVKNRNSFLNPSSFKHKYLYNLESFSSYNAFKDSVYVISFRSNNKFDRFSGKIWIDKHTYAYIRIEFNNNNITIPNPFLPIKFLSRNYQIIYENENGLYLPKYTSMKGRNYNSKTHKETTQTLEFLRTNFSCNDNLTPIPFEARLDRKTVFAEINNNYDENFWENSTTIETDSLLKNQIKPFYKIDEANKINIPQNIVLKKDSDSYKTKLNNIRKVAQKFSIGYAFNIIRYEPIFDREFMLSYKTQNFNNLHNTLKNPFILNVMTTYLGFELNRKSSISINSRQNLLKENYFNSLNLEYNYLFLLKKIGNPLFFSVSIGISSQRTGYYLGSISTLGALTIGNTNLGNKSNVYIGENNLSSLLGFGLEYRKKRYKYFIEMQYFKEIYSEEKLFFKSKMGFLSHKNANTNNFSNEIIFNPNNLYNGVRPIGILFGLKIGF
ncbi:hypothetical protein Emtol_2193 [Emticicia oligotrophica DSM 17448]|uniref:Carboxypeptidase-like regulatory domain-containing protein n=1 Tax=Emticicia oligotrophica (strain DSM 17448 / CIP 109782 / MTCC 6937 / GPTSA100-15) TaxID=929562 RepID=A0ABM5N1W6_EMTOG|nr:carboxypeptidase-like regulatory domain-containing protein [Emticicia oligotrophica]AFK03331.1 hypothetical protein Emtol_2193 [Emticicia oligotrophica DSM 17448]